MVISVGHSSYQVDKMQADDKPYDLKLQEFPGFAFVPLVNWVMGVLGILFSIYKV